MFRRTPGEFLVVGGAMVAVAASACAALLPPGSPRIVLVAAAVAAYGARAATGVRAATGALSAGVIAWSLVTGFLVNGGGELTFGRADLLRLPLFCAAGLSGAAYGMLRRRNAKMRAERDRRPHTPIVVRHAHRIFPVSPPSWR